MKPIFAMPGLRILISLGCIGVAVTPAKAEKADSLKDTFIEAGSTQSKGQKGVHVLSNGVLVTRGTLVVKAEKAVLTESPNGDQFVVLSSGSNGKVTFRQKRDGGADLWVDGEADRAEYDQSTEVVKFISKAKIRYLEGKKVTQEQEGEYLSYDSKNDVFDGANSTSGKHVDGGGRVKIILHPKTEKQAE